MPASDPTDLDTVIDALYTRPLDDFVTARATAARQAADDGDRLGAERVKRLPKPSVAAWVINQVVRDHHEEMAALTAVGDELRAATQDSDRARIRALDHLRRERTDALVRAVREVGEVGGRPVSAATLDRLTETLTAAVMDGDAATAVRAGRLSRALQHSGFGIVDEQGEEADLVTLHPARTQATPEAPEAPEAPEPDDERRTDEPDLATAERAVEEASAQVDRLEDRRDELRERLREAEAEVERARADLESIEDELDGAVERAAEARRLRRAARGR